MQRVERTARIGATPDAVFSYLSDLDNLPEWQSGIVSAEVTSGDGIGVGSTARVVRDVMGQRIEAPLTVSTYEPPRRLAIGGEVSGVTADAHIELEPAADGTTDLRFAMEIRARGMSRFIEPMIAGAAGGEIDASIRRIQERFAARP
jgi:carbon monoxide dehydrogenase subunit G